MNEPVFKPVVLYRDAKVALAWLEKAFGFETTLLVTNAKGSVGHAEMSFQGVPIGIGGEWDFGDMRIGPPAAVGGVNTQFTWITLQEGLDAHCEQARAAGARIMQEPAEQFYGDRIYRALDPEGHLWCFRQKSRAVSVEDMEAASGLKIKGAGN